jgi:transcriptional regulator with XRE-family HTH domain
MEVNAQKIKKLRGEKAWTQQHLADACSVSLRTVQRVERYGNASQETVLSLASVLEIDKNDIISPDIVVEVIEPVIHDDHSQSNIILFGAVFLGAIIGASVMYFVMASL